LRQIWIKEWQIPLKRVARQLFILMDFSKPLQPSPCRERELPKNHGVLSSCASKPIIFALSFSGKGFKRG